MFNKIRNMIDNTILKLTLQEKLKKYYDSKKNNYIKDKDFHKIPKSEISIKPINIDTISNIINNLLVNKNNIFNFKDLDKKTLCNKVFLVSISNLSNKIIEDILKKYNTKKDYVIDDSTNNEITQKLNKIKVSAKTALNHYTDNNEGKMKKNLINNEVVILFVYSGSFNYWINIIRNNKYIDYITKYKINYNPYYENFGKFKKEKGDFDNVRILNNFDRISKMISKYINYSTRYSIMKNMDKDMILSLPDNINELFRSSMPITQQYIHNQINMSNKIVLLDLSKAFDNINKDFLNLVISKYYPDYIINFINYQMFIINKKNTNIHNIHGISQGHPLSTTLFHLCHNIICQYIKEKIKELNIKIFVDDIAIYYDKEISNDIINNNNKIISNIYDIFGLSINHKKTITINIDNDNKWKNEYYLGVPMSNNYQDVRICLDSKYGKELLDKLNTVYINNTINNYDIYNKSLKFSLAYRLKFIKEFNSEEEKQKFILDMKNDNMMLYDIYHKYKSYEFVCMEDSIKLDVSNKDIKDNINLINNSILNKNILDNDLYIFI